MKKRKIFKWKIVRRKKYKMPKIIFRRKNIERKQIKLYKKVKDNINSGN